MLQRDRRKNQFLERRPVPFAFAPRSLTKPSIRCFGAGFSFARFCVRALGIERT